jgi:hypothetical protein
MQPTDGNESSNDKNMKEPIKTSFAKGNEYIYGVLHCKDNRTNSRLSSGKVIPPAVP